MSGFRCSACEHYSDRDALRVDLNAFCKRNDYDGLCIREAQYTGGHFVIRSAIEYCSAGAGNETPENRRAA